MKNKIITFIIINCILALTPMVFVNAESKRSQATVTIIVKSSPDSSHYSQLIVESEELVKLLRQNQVRKKADVVPLSDTYVSFIYDRTSVNYVMDAFGDLYNEQILELTRLPYAARNKLLGYAEALRARHYGEMLPWPKAKKVITMKSKFTVIDMESGLQFNVQRRAGRNHADVQPLTKKDTAIMKKIYNGKWSWDRKAILVKKDDVVIAASMHGMPHGGDGIPNNNFSGHFCIHFLNSSTHGSKTVDPGHQLMIHKAAGKLPDYFKTALPYDVIESFIAALQLKERHILKMTFTHTDHEQISQFINEMDQIVSLRKLTKKQVPSPGMIAKDIPIKLAIQRKGSRSEEETYIFHLRRLTVTDPWKIEHIEKED